MSRGASSLNVTINQLATFQRIVRLGSFHAAARDLRLTQPSVSQRVRELEQALNAPLFERRGPSLSLTPEGHALIEYANRVIEAMGELVDRFDTRDPLKGTLRLGVSESFALLCLPELLRRLEQRYPAIRTSVLVGDIAVRQKLNAQELDIAIVYGPAVGPRAKQEPLGWNEFVWVAASTFPLPKRTLLPVQLCNHHLIVPSAPSHLNGVVLAWFADAGIHPARVSTCNSVSAILRTVLHGTTIGILPRRVVEDELAKRTVKIARVSPGIPPQQVSICYDVSGFGTGVKVFVALAREIAGQYRLFSDRAPRPS
jgi:DNA-binding transcriptional LysR family regulator